MWCENHIYFNALPGGRATECMAEALHSGFSDFLQIKFHQKWVSIKSHNTLRKKPAEPTDSKSDLEWLEIIRITVSLIYLHNQKERVKQPLYFLFLKKIKQIWEKTQTELLEVKIRITKIKNPIGRLNCILNTWQKVWLARNWRNFSESSTERQRNRKWKRETKLLKIKWEGPQTFN